MELKKVSPLSQHFLVAVSGLNEEVGAPEPGRAVLSSSRSLTPSLFILIPELRPSSMFVMHLFQNTVKRKKKYLTCPCFYKVEKQKMSL